MNQLKQIDKRLLTILLIVFVQMLGAAMILPILPLYAKRAFNLEPEAIALLVSSFFAAQFLAGPYLGRLSDRYGRLPVLIISQIGTAFSFLMLALAPNAAFLFAARILDGITGGNIIVAQAYITDITPREKRTQSLGYIFAMFGLGFIFGPATGSLLSASLGPRIPYVIAAIAATLTVVLTYFTLNESLTPEQREANRQYKRGGLAPTLVVRNTSLLLILIMGFVGQFGLGMLQATFALYGEAVVFAGYSERITTIGIGLLLATIGISQFLTQMVFLRKAMKRFDEPLLVVIGILSRTVGFGLFIIVISPWVTALGGVFFALGMGFMMPALQGLSTQSVADELRGGVLGLYQSAVSLSTIVSTAIAGLIFTLNPRAPYIAGAVMTLVVLIPALILVRNPPEPMGLSDLATAVSD